VQESHGHLVYPNTGQTCTNLDHSPTNGHIIPHPPNHTSFSLFFHPGSPFQQH
jgi:hypothetical protein